MNAYKMMWIVVGVIVLAAAVVIILTVLELRDMRQQRLQRRDSIQQAMEEMAASYGLTVDQMDQILEQKRQERRSKRL